MFSGAYSEGIISDFPFSFHAHKTLITGSLKTVSYLGGMDD